MVTSQGAGAKAKDAQAAVKALEALVAVYVANLIPIVEGGSEGDALDHANMSHKEIVEMASAAEAPSVCRVDLSSDPVTTWGAVAERALESLLLRRDGAIGWLTSATVKAAEEKTELCTLLVGADANDGDGDASPDSAAEAVFGENNLVSPSSIAAQIQQLDADKLSSLTEKANKVMR